MMETHDNDFNAGDNDIGDDNFFLNSQQIRRRRYL